MFNFKIFSTYFIAFYLALSVFAQEKTPPNVIYILADDLGKGDLGCYGQKKLKTPGIDRLATEGMKFSSHYSGNTVCSPSRAVLMTGQHPGHVHCRGNGHEPTLALNPKMVTLPRIFKNAGYATGAFGKWGLGHEAAWQVPLARGFDTSLGYLSNAETYCTHETIWQLAPNAEIEVAAGNLEHACQGVWGFTGLPVASLRRLRSRRRLGGPG